MAVLMAWTIHNNNGEEVVWVEYETREVWIVCVYT